MSVTLADDAEDADAESDAEPAEDEAVLPDALPVVPSPAEPSVPVPPADAEAEEPDDAAAASVVTVA